MLVSFDTTFIALITKYNNPKEFKEFRPRSLYNCVYKVVAKIIALRIKIVLLETISNEQVGFLSSR